MKRFLAPCATVFCIGASSVWAADLAAPGLEGIALEVLSATRSRPLFSPARRAPEPPAPMIEETTPAELPVPVAESPPEQFLLVGIVLSSSQQVALLRDSQTGIVTRVDSGSFYGDRKLIIVGPRQIRLEGQSNSIVRRLFEAEGETAPDRKAAAESEASGLWR